jgi:hypothetical protein
MKVKAAPLADAAFRKGAKCGRQALLEEPIRAFKMTESQESERKQAKLMVPLRVLLDHILLAHLTALTSLA